jgi:hypothetical protein
MNKREATRASSRRQAGQKASGGQQQAWKWLLFVSLVALIGYGVWSYLQLPDLDSGTASYGLPAQETQLLQIKEAVSRAQGSPEPTVTVQGKVVDMGPTMGCWQLVRDGTGEMLVQTDPMVYVPQSLQGATMKATGKLVYGRFSLMNLPDYEGWLLLSPGVEVVTQS